ncbi:MAG: phosphate-starvation-inducible PsiE family protein [Methanosarcinales archaeon]|nr:phosphate-starvation-inducible PsiE family protein [Methanosarcinales archaeon]
MNFTVDHNWIFKKATNSIVIIILYILLLALLIGAVRLVLSIPQLMNNDGMDVTFYQIVANSLTLFIIIEFFKTLHDYSKYERIKLTFIIDATILIVLREISVGLVYQGIRLHDDISPIHPINSHGNNKRDFLFSCD